jgi:hypothetical protein
MKKTVPLLLIGLVMPCFSQNIFAADSGRAWNDNWLYVGGRLGGSVHFYQFGDYDIKNQGSFDFALQLSVPLLKNFGIQTELMYSSEMTGFSEDTTVIVTSYVYGMYGTVISMYSYYPGKINFNFKYNEFMLPILLRYNYEFGLFSIAGLFGPFFTVPTGKVEYTATLTSLVYSEEYKTHYDVEDLFGVMVGLNFGIKLGPGTLFLDLRYAIDNDMVKVDGDRFWHRNVLPLSIGYELGLLPKKR